MKIEVTTAWIQTQLREFRAAQQISVADQQTNPEIERLIREIKPLSSLDQVFGHSVRSREGFVLLESFDLKDED